jgi:hypothetical protein
MAIDKNKALAAGFKEGLIQLAEEIPGLSSFIEGIRSYHEYINEQQRLAFAEELNKRLTTLENKRLWYQTPDGEEFVKKVIATSLNAEYADKLEFLANALVNGPSLGTDQAKRLKFVEMIRQVSKPALEVLALALLNKSSTGEVFPGDIAAAMKWPPELVDACVRELHAFGAFSSVMDWFQDAGSFRPQTFFSGKEPATTALTEEFGRFITGASK